MPNVFLISDTHFLHSNFLTFKKADGSFVRPFSSVEEVDELMRSNWNRVVSKGDKVYHLGDVAMNKRGLQLMDGLNGSKVLIKGNHDREEIGQYLKYFRDIRAVHVLADCILSHIPVHVDQLSRFKRNLHGHLHHLRVQSYNDGDHSGEPDPRYRNVCVEHINYTPIPLEVAIKDWTL